MIDSRSLANGRRIDMRSEITGLVFISEFIIGASRDLDCDNARGGVQGQSSTSRSSHITGHDGNCQLGENLFNSFLIPAADVQP